MPKFKIKKEDFSESDKRNIQFQKSDAKGWLEQDSVIGVKVNRSNNCDPDCEICEAGAGDYPKDYEWTIWHPGCLCFITPIQVSEEEFDKHLDAIMDGEKYEFKGYVKDIPEKMKDFMKKTGFEHCGHEDYNKKK